MKWRSTTPSSRATLLLTRNGSQREVTVTLGEAAAVARDNNKGGDADGQTSLGVTVAPLTRERAQALGLSVNSYGLEVRSVCGDPSLKLSRSRSELSV